MAILAMAVATRVMAVAILVMAVATLAMAVATLDVVGATAVATAVAVAGHTMEVAEGAVLTLVKLLLHKLRMKLITKTTQST